MSFPTPPRNPAPSQAKHDDRWRCKECGFVNSGHRSRCRNCGISRPEKTAPLSTDCPACRLTGFTEPLYAGKTPRGNVWVCNRCGDEYEMRGPGEPVGPLKHRQRRFAP